MSFLLSYLHGRFILPFDRATHALDLLAEAGMKKPNISGGEPFFQPKYMGDVFEYCKEVLHLESCSVVTNGSKVTEKWLDTYGQYLDMIAISCDSFDVRQISSKDAQRTVLPRRTSTRYLRWRGGQRKGGSW